MLLFGITILAGEESTVAVLGTVLAEESSALGALLCMMIPAASGPWKLVREPAVALRPVLVNSASSESVGEFIIGTELDEDDVSLRGLPPASVRGE